MRNQAGHIGGALLTIAGAAIIATGPSSTVLWVLAAACFVGAVLAFGAFGAVGRGLRALTTSRVQRQQREVVSKETHLMLTKDPPPFEADAGSEPDAVVRAGGASPRIGYKGHPGSRGNLPGSRFGKDLDIGIDNEGDVSAPGAQFGVDLGRDKADTKA
jgi:uncharacterized protein (DUF58 family)